jgi:hypothetical protein
MDSSSPASADDLDVRQPTAGGPTRQEIEAEKLQLEREKLSLEIQELRKWWRRPAYIQAIFSIVIALVASVATVSLGYVNGWFDAQRGRLEIQRAKLVADVEKFEAEKASLLSQVSRLKGERDTLALYRPPSDIIRTRPISDPIFKVDVWIGWPDGLSKPDADRIAQDFQILGLKEVVVIEAPSITGRFMLFVPLGSDLDRTRSLEYMTRHKMQGRLRVENRNTRAYEFVAFPD